MTGSGAPPASSMLLSRCFNVERSLGEPPMAWPIGPARRASYSAEIALLHGMGPLLIQDRAQPSRKPRREAVIAEEEPSPADEEQRQTITLADGTRLVQFGDRLVIAQIDQRIDALEGLGVEFCDRSNLHAAVRRLRLRLGRVGDADLVHLHASVSAQGREHDFQVLV